MVRGTRWAILAAALATVAACSGSNSAKDVQGGDVGFGDTGAEGDQGTELDTATPGDVKQDDVSVPDTKEPDTAVPDTAVVDLVTPDVAVDLGDPDLGPEEAKEVDATAVAEKAYSKCETDADCPYPLECKTGLNNPLYGQCSLVCTQNEECPASPYGNSVGCVYGMCVSTCGVHGGTCPEWLNCTAQEFCLEPTSTVANKGPGESCTEAAECTGDAECVEGEVTKPYCAPICTTNQDCLDAAPEAYGQCTAAGGFNFCMFFCGMMGQNKPCPGDMVCEVVVCR